MSEEVTIPKQLLEDLYENTMELIGERHWWADEPRCGYQERYEGYAANAEDAGNILRLHESK